MNWIFELDFSSDKGLAEARQNIETTGGADLFALLNAKKGGHVPIRNVDLLRALYFAGQNQPHAAIESLKEELRYFPENQQATRLLKTLADANPTKPNITDSEFAELYRIISPYTMVGEARLYSLFTLAKDVCSRDIPGQFVECGVAAGGSSGLLATIIARYSRQPRKLFSFDSFEGMPTPSQHDVSNGQSAEATGWGTGTCAAPEASLREVCRKLDVEHLVQPVKGLFGNTLPIWRGKIGPIALLHMDGDWYSSTRDILENVFDQVVPGGRVQIDDYGYWDGCRLAVAEYEQKRSLTFNLTRIDETGVWLSR